MAQMFGKTLTRDAQAHAFAFALAFALNKVGATRPSDKRRQARIVCEVRDTLASFARIATIDADGNVERGAYVLPRVTTLADGSTALDNEPVIIDVSKVRAFIKSAGARAEAWDTPEACEDMYTFAHFLHTHDDAPAQPARYRRRVTGYALDIVADGDALDRAQRRALREARDDDTVVTP